MGIPWQTLDKHTARQHCKRNNNGYTVGKKYRHAYTQ